MHLCVRGRTSPWGGQQCEDQEHGDALGPRGDLGWVPAVNAATGFPSLMPRSNCLSPAFDQIQLSMEGQASPHWWTPSHPHSPLTCPLLLPEETTFEAGVKVQIHSQSEPPFVQELGFGVAPGFQTFVATQEQRVSPKFHLHTKITPAGPDDTLLLCADAP